MRMSNRWTRSCGTVMVAVVCGLIAGAVQADHHGGKARMMPLAMALQNESRAESDRARDAGRKPAQVLAFLGVGHGMTAVDLMASGGYYTEVLSLAVGPKGTVYAQNPAGFLRYRDGANDKALTARLAGSRLPNVSRLDKEMDAMGLPPGSVDAVITALNFHDIYNGSGPEAAAGVAGIVFSILKPGGVFGVIDHNGNPGNDNASLHRMPMQQAADVLTSVGFRVETSDLLSNPADTRDQGVFGLLRGKTDRFLIKAIKP